MGLNKIYRSYHKVFLGKIDLNKLNKDQMEITEMNVKKHTKIFLFSILAMVYTYIVISNYYSNSFGTVMTALFGVLFVSGTAWFAITFGAIPARYKDFAVQTTAYLFASFSFSMAAVFIAASVSLPLLTPIFFIAFFALYGASVKYDVADGLKIGIEEAHYKHSVTGRIYYVRELKKKKK
jgi:hypothetical protein